MGEEPYKHTADKDLLNDAIMGGNHHAFSLLREIKLKDGLKSLPLNPFRIRTFVHKPT
jgi:hypothetical protein